MPGLGWRVPGHHGAVARHALGRRWLALGHAALAGTVGAVAAAAHALGGEPDCARGRWRVLRAQRTLAPNACRGPLRTHELVRRAVPARAVAAAAQAASLVPDDAPTAGARTAGRRALRGRLLPARLVRPARHAQAAGHVPARARDVRVFRPPQPYAARGARRRAVRTRHDAPPPVRVRCPAARCAGLQYRRSGFAGSNANVASHPASAHVRTPSPAISPPRTNASYVSCGVTPSRAALRTAAHARHGSSSPCSGQRGSGTVRSPPRASRRRRRARRCGGCERSRAAGRRRGR